MKLPLPVVGTRRKRRASASRPLHHTYAFGEYLLDLDRGALLRDGTEVKLRRLAFEVLVYLVRHRGRLVTKDELMSTIWAGTVVTDGALTQCLIEIRRALGDASRQVIRTVPRRGYAFDAPVTEHGRPGKDTGGQEAPAGNAGGGRMAVLALAVVAAVTAAAWWVLEERAANANTAPTSIAIPRSIAVLPFVDMSEHHDQAYFSDGMAEEILNLLSRSSDLQVIGRTSSFSFRGSNADIATIAAKLNVAWVLEGSVRRSGDRIRVDVRLVDAATGLHRWAETYDRRFRDVLDVQSEIAEAVAAALQAKLSATAFGGSERGTDPEAHALYLQGRYYFDRRAPGDLDRAAGSFRRALERESNLGAAWAGLAGVYWLRIDERSLSPAESREWREAVEQALAVAPQDAGSYERAAQYYWESGDRERALANMARADALNPDPSRAAVREMFAGRFDAIVEWHRRNATRDPLSITARHNFAAHLMAAGRLDEALAELEQALALNPAYQPTFDTETAFIFILQRRFDEALARIDRLPDGYERDAALALVRDALGDRAGSDAALRLLSERGGSRAARRVAEVYAQRGEIDAAFRWLARGRREATGRGDLIDPIWVIDLRLSPFLAPLHADPRWQELMALWIE